jgi:MFS family permease
VAGVPLARLADRGWNARVLSASVVVWSVMTAVCSKATSVAGMLAARMGVGIGEAGGGPAMQALIGHYFSPTARARAISAVTLTASIGAIFGLAAGGYLNDHYGWRKAFTLLAAPGLVLGALMLLTMKEPMAIARPGMAADPQSLKDTLRDLLSRPSYVHITIGLAVSAVGCYGLAAWIPTFYMRTHAMSATEAGTAMAAASAPASLLGILLGGILADKLSKRDARWPVWLFMAGLGGVTPVYLAFFLVPNATVGIILTFPAGILASLWIAPGIALILNLAGPRSRATAAAIFGLAINLVGMGLGPLAVGVLSDLYTPSFGEDALKYALCTVLLTLTYGLAHFHLAARTVNDDLLAASRLAGA